MAASPSSTETTLRPESGAFGDRTGDGFWRFSLTLYAQPGVADACLRFQDEGGGDVNLLLFTLYAGRCGAALTAAEMAEAIALSARWRAAVVGPLRDLRRALKGGVEGFDSEPIRSEVKRLELQAEQDQQRRLARILTPVPQGDPPEHGQVANDAAGAANLELLLGAMARGAVDAVSEASQAAARQAAEDVRSALADL